MTIDERRVLLLESSSADGEAIQGFLDGAEDFSYALKIRPALSEGVADINRFEHDVILLDLESMDRPLPETVGLVCSQAPSLPIVVLAGADQGSSTSAIVAQGAQDCLLKGAIDTPILVRAIEHAIRRKQLEQELRAMEIRLQFARREKAIREISAGIAHDFNNLLCVIRGTAELVMDDLSVDSPHRSDLREVLKATNWAAELARQLLTMNTGKSACHQKLNLNECIHDMRNLLASVVGKAVETKIMLDPTDTDISAETSRIERIILNLATNARDAMPDGGVLTIETQSHEFNKMSDDENETLPKRCVTLIVTDTGCGMEPEVLSKVFTPYFSTKETGKGTGLGLANVHSLVRDLGGSIDIKSSPQRGTTITITFPLSPQLAKTGT